MNPSSIESCHGPIGRTRVIVLDEAIVVAFGLHLRTCPCQQISHTRSLLSGARKKIAYVLIGDDLDILDMSRGLEYLAQHILSHSLVQAANVEGPLVRLRRSSSEARGGREDATAIYARAGRCDGRRDRVVVLRNMERRRGEVSWVALAVLGGRGAHGLRSGRDSASVGHCRDWEVLRRGSGRARRRWWEMAARRGCCGRRWRRRW